MNKIKIRIASTVFLILENDAERFHYIKSDDSPNKNGLLNKLIPNLLVIRKLRREKIRQALSDMGKERAEEIYESVNQVIDEVYFDDLDLDILDAEIWILPTAQSQTAFDEICDSETKIAALSVTEYLRGMLNEYAMLPQYKREHLVFYREIRLIHSAFATTQILRFECNGEKYKFFVYQYVYGYLYDQTNYLIGYDIDRKQIRSFPIARLKKLYLLKKKYKPSENLMNSIENYHNESQYGMDNIVDWRENDEEE